MTTYSKEARRAFLIGIRNPQNAPRLSPAVNAVIDYLKEHECVPLSQLLAVGLAASDIQEQTLRAKLMEAVVAGFITQDPVISLVDWPEPSTT